MLVNNPVIAYSKQRGVGTIGLDFTLNRRGTTRISNRSTCDFLIKGQGEIFDYSGVPLYGPGEFAFTAVIGFEVLCQFL